MKMNLFRWSLEYPQYTRPEFLEGERIPEVLISGHHENIRKWRRLQSLLITKERRPDLMKSGADKRG